MQNEQTLTETPPKIGQGIHDQPPFTQVLKLALLFAGVKLAIQVTANIVGQHEGYGIFRDELYYLVCGRHLAWGYVDMQPLAALQARVAQALFGIHHLALLRIFSALAGSAMVLLTGLLAWTLGGRRPAQAIAMTGVLAAGIYLGIDNFLSMNSFEPVFWMTCMLAVLQIAREGPPRAAAIWWIVFGVSGGLALENKLSAVFFLFCLMGALLLTPQRKLLKSRWAAVAVALIVLIELPNFLWQIERGFPTLVLLSNIAHSNKNVVLGPAAFISTQVLILNPLNLLLWCGGLVWLLFRKRFRFAGILYLLFLPLMIALHAKAYYVVPIYPVLFAAGGVAWQQWLGPRYSRVLIPVYAVLLLLIAAVFFPMVNPVLPPQGYIAYAKRLHFQAPATEDFKQGPLLPQFYADRFGWRSLANQVASVYRSLSPEDRSQVCIWGDNYGEASAVNVYDPGLPRAISGHQNYYYWGPRACTGKVMIVMGSDGRGLARDFQSCEVVGALTNPYAMPYERRKVYLCHGYRGNFVVGWAERKNWY